MDISVTVEGMCGLTWPLWKRLVAEVERLGFAGLYRSDHFTLGSPPNLASLELIVSLAYLATHSERLKFGPLVAPFSFRDPVMLARQAMHLDDLSGGRMILGVGAGWMEREHDMFGYPLGDVTTRLDRLEEGLEIVSRLIRSDDPVDFVGRFYQLEGAQLMPRPQRTTPILLGAKGPKRTLPMTARYADIWNASHVSAGTFGRHMETLDALLDEHGRQPEDLKRSVMLLVLCGRDDAEIERRLDLIVESVPQFARDSPSEMIDYFNEGFKAIIGRPETVIERLRAYAEAGVDEVMLQWFGMNDLEGLALLAETLLPAFGGNGENERR
jgi:alkanesulfonate monooxygenase SsuD/methylene tetrahydromethanopterin reductase-like flavin-dependent oxidoreductase (luciferase family)